MTEVWTCHVTEGGPESALMELLSAEERRRHKAFHFERHRREFLYAHAVKRLALSRYAGLSPRDWQFALGEWGKPKIAGAAAALEFNLSHTAGLVACAVSDEVEVGVDVERVTREVDALTIARRFFAPEEIRQIEAQDGERGREAFFRIWTLKESYVKALGRGFHLPLREFCFCLNGGRLRGPAGWHFTEWIMDEDYRIAVASPKGVPVLRDARELIEEYAANHEDSHSRRG